MCRCNCCKKSFASSIEFIEKGKVIGTMNGAGYVPYDLILVNCLECNSTKALKTTEIVELLFKTSLNEKSAKVF